MICSLLCLYTNTMQKLLDNILQKKHYKKVVKQKEKKETEKKDNKKDKTKKEKNDKKEENRKDKSNICLKCITKQQMQKATQLSLAFQLSLLKTMHVLGRQMS